MEALKENTNKPKKSIWETYKLLYIGSSVVIVLYFGSYILIKNTTKNFTEQGQTGDTFGAINALFSGLAFVALIYTILQQKETIEMQSDELELQRKAINLQTDELKLQREELADTRHEFETQNQTLKIQRFENTFYQMLQYYNSLTKDMKIRMSEGKSVFGIIYYEIAGKFNYNPIAAKEGNVLKASISSVIAEFKNSFSTYEYYIGPYMRFIYQILKMINNDISLTENEKHNYCNQLRAQLSNFELVILYYFCLSEDENNKMKPLVEKYSLLRHIDDNYLIDIEGRDNYDSITFATSVQRKQILSDRLTAEML